MGFQNFDEELRTIDAQYNKAAVALVIAYLNECPVGCAAIRKLDDETAELKRMFVLPEHRHRHLGKNLLEWCLITAKEIGYVHIRLDTLSSMKHALSLYYSSGFYEIPAYRFNAFADAVFMEKKL